MPISLYVPLGQSLQSVAAALGVSPAAHSTQALPLAAARVGAAHRWHSVVVLGVRTALVGASPPCQVSLLPAPLQ